jgi:hypothetical protein
MRHAIVLIVSLVLTACNFSVPQTPTSGPARAKIEGPPVKTLSYEQLTWYDNECMRYGNIEDERVVYSSAYCRAVDAERNAKSLGRTSSYRVMKGYPTAH